MIRIDVKENEKKVAFPKLMKTEGNSILLALEYKKENFRIKCITLKKGLDDTYVGEINEWQKHSLKDFSGSIAISNCSEKTKK